MAYFLSLTMESWTWEAVKYVLQLLLVKACLQGPIATAIY